MHGAVFYSGQFSGQGLDAVIVGGHHPVGLGVVELGQENLGHGGTKVGVRTGTKFINEYQGLGIRRVQEILHFRQLRAVGGEFVFYALRISDIGHQPIEPPHGAIGVDGDQKAALQHELQQADRL